ncbi:MAG: tRNA uridine-5-carboxymethylaminomethyl(34) synthesis GTPase MnmE [gamma proteobacterium endosymbiont of Lamellibrachia anaximandri]|nr:tRNA uridine-5-carboxymethylaminomethyl(34) synthesis GTPase MnmE [gamma proteobacterium endosymbiont of Lamellibrachia anaximandri]
MQPRETIAAVATPPGRGGVGIIRVSGPRCVDVATAVTGNLPNPRHAQFSRFSDADGSTIDEGICLYFPAPNSFTGEDVLELQGHGGPLILDLLLQRVLGIGVRAARPGEFSERAFLNGKLDLAQAEAIADLIDAETTSAARLASRTLQGVFSERIHKLVEGLINLRLYVESAIDFPEEEIDFLSDGKVSTNLQSIIDELSAVQKSAHTGRLMRDGMTLVIAGRPNAGKSSLLNALAERDSAIVTEIPGTTRDLLREQIQIDGMPIHIIDTAGMRESTDPVEQEGIRRAKNEIDQADRILWVFDDKDDPNHLALDRESLPEHVPLTLIRNKIDLSGTPPALVDDEGLTEIFIAAKSSLGIDLLKDHLKQAMGYTGSVEGEFIARRRHLNALANAMNLLHQGKRMLEETAAGELLAEDLRLAQQSLNEITGEFTADDLLGRIFSTFCIGK